ncbi:SMI1/KNR4 family protein [Cronbergia sp. UHCC 0137]|uniref:SMI1/KNR4 family protein n=1 Tax=Cronbergia sp. UHCC 0137 TaxID=3110239 RepID=UPI002B20B68D|nr:SMI1/KNR4 family protein [Cronbergia sp. UHCC 0137]MEA5617534.1 SMI1/KNR4 family protein [Cronbergia sp. UHCC 0137]
MNKLLQLKQKLKQLAILDATFEVFGSESHEYQLNSCLKDVDIQAFETQYQITLPNEYRCFLLEVGNGGAGPGYGLYKILEPICKNEMVATPSQKKYDIISQTFSLTQAWNNLDLPKDAYLDDKFIQGAFVIANYGCGIYALLVITGEQKGKIWIDDRTNDSGIYPASKNFCHYFHDLEPDDFMSDDDDGEPLSFYDWYEDWLNRSLEQVSQV